MLSGPWRQRLVSNPGYGLFPGAVISMEGSFNGFLFVYLMGLFRGDFESFN